MDLVHKKINCLMCILLVSLIVMIG